MICKYENCYGLTSIILGNSISNIDSRVFSHCTGLKEIYCYAKIVPNISDWAFYWVDVSNILLVVPDESVEQYKSHPVWGQFMIETPTGIHEIDRGQLSTDDEPIYYNVTGQHLNKMQTGIIIVGGKKVLVK